jgi:hypothetical protein
MVITTNCGEWVFSIKMDQCFGFLPRRSVPAAIGLLILPAFQFTAMGVAESKKEGAFLPLKAGGKQIDWMLNIV